MQNKNQISIIFGFLLILSVILSIFAHFVKQFPGDLFLTTHLQSLHNSFLLSFMQGISYIFGSWRLALLVVLIAIFVWRWIGKCESLLIITAGLFSLIAVVLKILIGRPRPAANLVQILSMEQDNGFPSGHAISAILILGLIAYLSYDNIKNRTLRTVVPVVLILLIVLIGISRVYLGVHWPSDVIGGYLIGGTLLTLLIRGYRYWKIRYTDNIGTDRST